MQCKLAAARKRRGPRLRSVSILSARIIVVFGGSHADVRLNVLLPHTGFAAGTSRGMTRTFLPDAWLGHEVRVDAGTMADPHTK